MSGPIRFNNDTRTRLIVTVRTDFDPADATLELRVDGTWYPATWSGVATATTTPKGPQWTRPARTTGYFAGPDAAANGATVLAVGRHYTETRVTLDGDALAYESTPVDVA